MTRLRTPQRLAVVFVSALMLVMASAPALATADELARAKELYATASYDEALQILEALHVAAPEKDATEVEAYRVFCLVALGRTAEAKRAAEAIVKAEPLFHPSEAQASPRVRTFFENVRRPMLADIVRQSYGAAKDAFDRKNMPDALSGFDRVIALLDEMGADDAGVSDLRTLAAGFRDLSKAAIPPPRPPAPQPPPVESAGNSPAEPTATASVAPPTPAAPAKAGAPVAYSANDTDVQAPVAISQPLPRWVPENPIEEKRTFRGTLDLLVAEDGHVITATLTKSVHPRYDATLLKAAQDWKFRPAMKNGVPVQYHYAMAVQLGR